MKSTVIILAWALVSIWRVAVAVIKGRVSPINRYR